MARIERVERRDEHELHPHVRLRHLAEDPLAQGLEARAAPGFERRCLHSNKS